MDNKTPNLQLYLLKEYQMQKELTINEAIIWVDAAMNKQVESITINIPPEQPEQGKLFYVPQNAKAEWAEHKNKLALYYSGWRYIKVTAGYSCWVGDKNQFMLYTDKGWVTIFSEGSSTNDNKK